MEIDFRFDRARLFDHGFYRDYRRAFLTLRIAARPRKPIDEYEVREISLTQDWSPSLNVSAENFVLCRSVWL